MIEVTMEKMLLLFMILFSINISIASENNGDNAIKILLGERVYDDFINKTEKSLKFEKDRLIKAMRMLIDQVQSYEPTSEENSEMESLLLAVQNADLLMEEDLRKIFSELENKYDGYFTDEELIELNNLLNSSIRKKFIIFQNHFLEDLNSRIDNYNEEVSRKLGNPDKKLAQIVKALYKRKERKEREAPTPLEVHINESEKNIIVADKALDVPYPKSAVFKDSYQIASIDNYELIFGNTDNLVNLIDNIQVSKNLISPFLPPFSENKITFSASSMSLDTAMVSYADSCKLPLLYSRKIMSKFKFTGRIKLNERLYCESLIYLLASNGLVLSKTGSKLSIIISPFELKAVDESAISIIKVRKVDKKSSNTH
jgi:hypothetical protein